MPITLAMPLLRVTDVRNAMLGYLAVLGFWADPFAQSPPQDFAILRHGTAELMLKSGCGPTVLPRQSYDRDVDPRLENTPFRKLYTRMQTLGIVKRRLERMFYGMAEFEVRDPDGYPLCLGQLLEDMSDLPTPEA